MSCLVFIARLQLIALRGVVMRNNHVVEDKRKSNAQKVLTGTTRHSEFVVVV